MTERVAEDIAAIARIKEIPALLDIACRITGVGFAAVARVTRTRWVAAVTRDDMGFGLAPGGELPVETTLCRELEDCLRSVVIDDVAADPVYNAHPAPALYGFRSYIAVPILRADGSFFGTLCAMDKAPRRLNTPETVTMFETFAGLIGFHLAAGDRAAASEAHLLSERRTSALREQFIAVLGHDLRNPLTAILGGMEMLRKNPLNDRAAQWAEMVVASATRMAGLIDVVMDFSRSRLGGGLSVECVHCDTLEPMLRRMLAEWQEAKPSREIHGRFAIAVPVQCDLRRVAQLAENLLSNALNYGDPDRPTLLTAATGEGWFELQVSNAGAPIPEELLNNIFEPFARGAVQPNREGLGLGLYISNQIAMAHGGSLRASSSPEETRFTFRMPVNQPG